MSALLRSALLFYLALLPGCLSAPRAPSSVTFEVTCQEEPCITAEVRTRLDVVGVSGVDLSPAGPARRTLTLAYDPDHSGPERLLLLLQYYGYRPKLVESGPAGR